MHCRQLMPGPLWARFLRDRLQKDRNWPSGVEAYIGSVRCVNAAGAILHPALTRRINQ